MHFAFFGEGACSGGGVSPLPEKRVPRFVGPPSRGGRILDHSHHRIRQLRSGWIHALGNGLVIALSVINVFVHSRDGYTSVVPTGIILSGIVVLIMMITGWLSGERFFRHCVGVTE